MGVSASSVLAAAMFSVRIISPIAALAVLVCHLHCVAHHAWNATELVRTCTQARIVETPYSAGNQGTCDNVSGCICKGATLTAPSYDVVDAGSLAHGVILFVDTFALAPLSVGPAASAFALHPPAPLSGNARLALLSSFRC